ncbi:MAG: hypothetical protein LRZ88_03460 [Candidatus Cloacimonetes bacterium]|nr:hypothetical protein [Candidatus Cloacimonadota bacterium]
MNKSLLLLIPLFLLASSCKMLFKAPEIDKIQDVKMRSFTPDRTEVEVSIIVHNPNNYEIQLNALRLDLLDKDRLRVGTAELSRKIDLPKKEKHQSGHEGGLAHPSFAQKREQYQPRCAFLHRR